jgi:hypothetical protein
MLSLTCKRERERERRGEGHQRRGTWREWREGYGEIVMNKVSKRANCEESFVGIYVKKVHNTASDLVRIFSCGNAWLAMQDIVTDWGNVQILLTDSLLDGHDGWCQGFSVCNIHSIQVGNPFLTEGHTVVKVLAGGDGVTLCLFAGLRDKNPLIVKIMSIAVSIQMTLLTFTSLSL